MKKLFGFVSVFCLLLSLNASAEELVSFSGGLIKVPAVVKVLNSEGVVVEYAITDILNTGSVYGRTLSLSRNGMMTMCGDYLGQLAEDFTIAVDVDGVRKNALVRADNANDRKVSVFGICQGDSNVLTQLQIDVKTDQPVEIF